MHLRDAQLTMGGGHPGLQGNKLLQKCQTKLDRTSSDFLYDLVFQEEVVRSHSHVIFRTQLGLGIGRHHVTFSERSMQSNYQERPIRSNCIGSIFR